VVDESMTSSSVSTISAKSWSISVLAARKHRVMRCAGKDPGLAGCFKASTPSHDFYNELPAQDTRTP